MILDQIVAAKRRANAGRSPIALDGLVELARALPPPRSLAAALRPPLQVIAEFKRKSPSAGAIRPGADPGAIAAEYEAAGAAALSVLTDVAFFDGNPAHVARARAASALPILRKDFLLDERDVIESRLLEADAVLLIVRLLDAATLRAMLATARSLGMDALVETHYAKEIEQALAAGALVVGVNHRDLDTLAIDLGLSARARSLAGPEVTLVAESGIQTRAHVAQMRANGADAILVGEALMKAASPGAALRELLS